MVFRMSQSEDSFQLSQEVTLSHMSNNFPSWSSLLFPLKLWTPLSQHSQVPDTKKSSYFQVGIPRELFNLTLCKTDIGQFSKITLCRHTCTHTVEKYEICPAQSLQNGIGYAAGKRLSTPWLWVVKPLYSGEHVEESRHMVNLSKNQQVFLPDLLVCQNSHTKNAKGKTTTTN